MIKGECVIAAAVSAAMWLLVAGCGGSTGPNNTLAGIGNPQRGKQLITQYGCGACHEIPGIRTARGLVGPPLVFFGDRTTIAGELPNTPANLIRWIENPPAVEPHNAMPNLGVSPEQAQDIAAYLYTLRGHRNTQ